MAALTDKIEDKFRIAEVYFWIFRNLIQMDKNTTVFFYNYSHISYLCKPINSLIASLMA